MKHTAALFLASALLCSLLTACVPPEAADPTDSATLPPEPIVETIPFESLPADAVPPGIPPGINPSLPIETIPQKPSSDYSLPPGESPGSNASSH